MTEEKTGLICAYKFKGKGGGESITWEDIHKRNEKEGCVWVHLDRENEESAKWLFEKSGVDHVICHALTADETRPRCLSTKAGMLLILRGMNLNEGEEPEDMISLRMWIEEKLIVTLRRPKLKAVGDIIEALENEEGPKNSAEFLVMIIQKLIGRIAPVINEIDDLVDSIEEQVIGDSTSDMRFKISSIRRKAIMIRRYLAPQREALSFLLAMSHTWVSAEHKQHIHEESDRLIRYIEDLDEARDRAAVCHEELSGRISDNMNRMMYVLAIVSTVFLPLGLLTGLLGINVGGIPGSDQHYGFAFVCLLLFLIATLEFMYFKKKRWF